MSSINDKMDYLKETKSAIKTAIQNKGVTVLETDTFRSYAEKIASIDGSGSGGGITDAELGAATFYKIILKSGQLYYNYDYVEEDALSVANKMLKDLSEGKQVLLYLSNGENSYCRGFAYCTKLATAGSPSRYITFYGYTGTINRLSDVDGASRLKIDTPTFAIKYNPDTLEAEGLSVYFSSLSYSILETDRNYTKIFMPTKDFHPATKKYVDDAVANNSSGVTVVNEDGDDQVRIVISETKPEATEGYIDLWVNPNYSSYDDLLAKIEELEARVQELEDNQITFVKTGTM